MHSENTIQLWEHVRLALTGLRLDQPLLAGAPLVSSHLTKQSISQQLLSETEHALHDVKPFFGDHIIIKSTSVSVPPQGWNGG